MNNQTRHAVHTTIDAMPASAFNDAGRVIISLTANSTLDHMLFVPSFTMNTTMRATQTYWGLGGKPADASWVLGELGIPSLALGFYAGVNGRRAEALMQSKGVVTDFLWVDGETRINTLIVSEDGAGEATITTVTMDVPPAALNALRQQVAAALTRASVLIVGGTLPRGLTPDFYTEMLTMACEAGVPTIFDAAEPNLSVGLAAHPTFVKPNRDELSALVGRRVEAIDDVIAAGHDLLDRYETIPVITLSEAGAVVVLPDRVLRVHPLVIDVVSAAGAGDATLAGIAASVHRGEAIETGVRLGAACSAAVCLLPGTADCRRADIDRLLPLVQVEQV